MKIYFFYIVLGLTICNAQNKQILYEWDNPAQTLLLNPGTDVTTRYHYSIPLLSQIHLSAGSSGVTTYEIFGRGGGNLNEKIREKVFEMDADDFFTANQQLELMNFGWRAKNDTYYSVGIYEELDVIAYFPRDFAILAIEGNKDYLGYQYDFEDINFRADLVTVHHFGINKQVTRRLNAGIRLKVYWSMLNIRSTNNRGTLTTTRREGTSNVYKHTLENFNLEVETSGYASLGDEDEDLKAAALLLRRASFGGNLGVGMDAGITYDISRELEFTASVLDLGAIFHVVGVESYKSSGDYTFEGIELVFPEIGNGDSSGANYTSLEDEFTREVGIDTVSTAYTQLRPLKVNAGLSYSFGRAIDVAGDCNCRGMANKRNTTDAVGLQYYSVFRPKGLQMAGTLFYRRRFSEGFLTKVTYTIDPYSASNVGLGVSFNIGVINVYFTGDNLLDYLNIAKAKSVSLQLGFNVIVD